MKNKKHWGSVLYIDTNNLKWYQKLWYKLTRQKDKLRPKWEILEVLDDEK